MKRGMGLFFMEALAGLLILTTFILQFNLYASPIKSTPPINYARESVLLLRYAQTNGLPNEVISTIPAEYRCSCSLAEQLTVLLLEDPSVGTTVTQSILGDLLPSDVGYSISLRGHPEYVISNKPIGDYLRVYRTLVSTFHGEESDVYLLQIKVWT